MLKCITLLLPIALLCSPLQAEGNPLGEALVSAPPERISFLVTFGEDKCPKAAGDEIVVCAAQPESERYRVPESLRKAEGAPVRGGSWTSAVESLDGYARAVLPNSCSVNGSNGFTGCSRQGLQAWFAERRGKSEGR
ncbi:hypothetical protein GGR91_000813 [Sphingorhabdus rigui]|uniref:Uncharacterized protein n=1 Tax=Sphingorhabdus rigui TaxID=1282858 RepID=A0A840AY77_9SPHN|nr:hypothetical protein [Sphingorhabdus rigui]MBB3942591.1 hypothetical protein [Sphingorhabdus rigui]